jgi:hypothetical protein
VTLCKFRRYALLAGAAFSQGASLGPLIAAAAMMDAGLVLTAFCGTAILFACFSLAALVSRRRRCPLWPKTAQRHALSCRRLYLRFCCRAACTRLLAHV